MTKHIPPSAIRTALVLAGALFVIGCSQPYSKISKVSPVAVAGSAGQKLLQSVAGKLGKQPLARIGVFLDSAQAASLELASNPSDAEALADYNFAVGRIVEIVEDEELTPWEAPLACPSADGTDWLLSFDPVGPYGEFSPGDFVILPTDRYRFRGTLVGERKLKPGIGAPVMVSSATRDYTELDEFAQGKSLYYGLTAAIQFDGKRGNLFVKDPLKQETLQLDGHTWPMAGDFQSPLALALAELDPRKWELAAVFKPDENLEGARLARLQPYDPAKIPVLFVHGFSNSAATWVPMITSLREDPVIRQSYQFWVYNYPTGVPYPIAAAHLRERLDAIGKRYPDHKDMVVIGHSMGGMISRALVLDSGTTLWDAVFEKPPGEMGFDEATRQLLSDILIFEARADIDRVIYASASHRGAAPAAKGIGRFGAKLLGDGLPSGVISPEVINASRNGGERGRIPNAVDVLDPESPFLHAVDTLPDTPGIPYHSLIGDRGKGGNLDKTKPVSTDGVVPYWSSHLEGAASELVIPTEHWTILEPEGIAEVNRILHLHLEHD